MPPTRLATRPLRSLKRKPPNKHMILNAKKAFTRG